MKTILGMCFLLCLLLTNCVQQEKNPLEGSWQLVTGKMVSNDTVIYYPVSTNSHHMKSIGKNYFSTIWQDTTLNKSDWWFAGFNGGTYTFKDGIYTEQLIYFSVTDYIGLKVAFKTEIENDTLFLTPYSDKGNEEKYGTFEKWKRLE